MQLRNLFIGLGKAVFFWGFVQIALIGAAYFNVLPSSYHAMGGNLMLLALLLMLILSIVGKMGGRIIGLSLLAFAMLAAQSFLLRGPGMPDIVKALHPIFGIGVMFLGQSLAKRASQLPK
ncbi:MAG: hypothetical protein KIT46_05420 [Anaerolineales bacterium]|nr:hypothetical protein [Anaerolineales bacterium]MCW5855472.1 hypothetical protein [Anaerolineales bacterium]